MLNPQTLKKDFPIFHRQINDKELIYLDNASTSQKPASVIKAVTEYYLNMNANIHRGIHTLSEEATTAFEQTRKRTAQFINAKDPAEIIFTRNTTEAINLVAYTWGEQNINEGDEILISALEHHSNLIPWQELCRRKKAILRIIPLNNDGTLDLSNLDQFISEKTKLVAVSAMSNVLGTIVPVKKIIEAAHKVGAITLIDGAQSVAHIGVNVQELNCDFLSFSSHKMLGPTGVGILYGRKKILEEMPPFLFGGDMVLEVRPYQASWNELPWKFEAGTSNIADVIAFEKALEYIEKIGFKNILQHDQELLKYAHEKLSTLPGIQLYGPKDITQNGGIISFNIPGIHPHDIGSILNDEGIAIRAGHHCAQPLMQRLKVPATARLSFYIYNTKEDIDRTFEALQKVYKIFKL